MIHNIEPSGTHASAYQFVPSNLRPSPYLRLAVAIGASMLAIGVVLLAGVGI